MARKRKAKDAVVAEQHDAHIVDMTANAVEVTEAPADEIEAIVAQELVEAEIEAIAVGMDNEPEAPVVEAPVVEAPVVEAPVQDFATILQAVDTDDITHKMACVDDAFMTRAAFEIAKNPNNGNIHKTLKKTGERLAREFSARVLIATNVDPEVINRSTHEGSAYNVYAIDKLADLVSALAGGPLQNAINRACMRSLFAFRAAGLTFTGEMAKAAASDKIRVEAKFKDVLVRHTVSAGTAPTQASSTMQALTTLGIVKREGSAKNPTYSLVDGPVVTRLEKLLAA